MKKYSVYDVANWFLSKDQLTPKKIEKLTYYTEAWAYALFGNGIISDSKFEAWAHGPVSPELYRKYKEYGWNYVPKVNQTIDFDEQALDLLESVWVTYGDKSANELEVLTHTELPWKNARKGLQENERSHNLIDAEDMKTYYRSIYSGE